jgi:hypothetical protein
MTWTLTLDGYQAASTVTVDGRAHSTRFDDPREALEHPLAARFRQLGHDVDVTRVLERPPCCPQHPGYLADACDACEALIARQETSA